MTRRDFIARGGLGLASGALALGLGEVAARLLRRQEPLVRLQQFSDLVEDEHRIDAAVFESDPELFWRLAPNVRLPEDARPLFGVVSNGQGLRADHEIEPHKPAGATRLLFVGDSCTFGYLVGHTETFVACAQAALREALPGARVECLNAGVPGYTLFQGWRYLATRAARWQPDLVVLNFGWNEAASWDGYGDLEQYARMQALRPIAPLAHLRLCQLLWQVVREPALLPPGTVTRPRVLPHEFRDLLARSEAAVRSLGAELLVLVGAGRSSVERSAWRDYLTPLQEEQRRFGRSLRFGPGGEPGLVDEIEVLQALSRERAAPEIFFDRVHLTPEANQRVGAAIARRIAPWLAQRARS